MLVRSLAGIGETAAMIVGAPSGNGAVSENDLLRMRVAALDLPLSTDHIERLDKLGASELRVSVALC